MPPKKKSKPISKADKPEKVAHDGEDNEDDGEVFSQSFRDRLDQYSSLSKEVLTIKADLQGSSPNQEIKDRRERVSARVEEASSTILREELESLEEWIAEQQKNLAAQVSRIHTAYDQNKKSLETTGAFTSSEIQKQLQSVRARADERQAIHDSYGTLMERSKNIYN